MSKKKLLITYLLSFTWGCIITSIGVILSLCLLITRHKPKLYNGYVHFKLLNNNWGGMSFGPFIFTDIFPSTQLLNHECGHSIQNIILGPLMPFIVSIPSAVRYWLRNFKTIKGKYVYVSIFSAILYVISFVFLFTNVWYVGMIILLYTIILDCWLIINEIPKYKNNVYVPYDDIWFEKSATDIGNKLFTK